MRQLWHHHFSRLAISASISHLSNHLVLFLQNFARVRLLIRHVNALETVDVLGKTRLGDVSLPGLDGLHQGVVDEHVLLLGLHQAVTLLPNMENILFTRRSREILL